MSPKYIPPSGPVRADLLVLGEAPGADEEAQGQNFVGPSGSLLRLMLRNAGIDPNAVRYMNVCRFRPPQNEIKHYIKPLPKKPKESDYLKEKDGVFSLHYRRFEEFQGKLVLPFIKEHHNSLLADIHESKPKVILALGGTAFWALTEHLEGIGTWMGSVIPINILGHTCILVAAQHPARDPPPILLAVPQPAIHKPGSILYQATLCSKERELLNRPNFYTSLGISIYPKRAPLV